METNSIKGSSIKKKRVFSKTILYLVVIVLSVIFLSPFVWMLSTSLKTQEEIYSISKSILPEKIYWTNYKLAVTEMPFLRYFFNTAVITILVVVGICFSSSLVAYAMSKIEWKGKKILFPVIIATMMIPSQVTMIPLYIVYTKMHMVGTILPLTLPYFLGGGAYYIFLLRQFFPTIPNSLVESARIDGASHFTIYSRIMLPLCKPALTSVGIFAFMFTWSDFMGPLLYLNKQEQYTLSIGLQAFMGTHFVEWGPLMAASTIFTVPVILIFFFAQKYFIEGITVTGIKG